MPALDDLFATLQLRVLTARRSPLNPGWKVDSHLLPCNKIYLCYAGSGGYSIDETEFHLSPGRVGLLPAKHRNRCWHNPQDPFDKIWIHFDARVLGLVDLFDVIPCPPPLSIAEDAETRGLLESLVREHQDRNAPPFRTLALNGLLALALARILRAATAAGAARPVGEIVLRGPGDRIGAVLHHIAEHYAKPLTLEDLATVVHLHPTYFSNTFRKATGMAPMSFLQRFRIERAKGLLATSDLAVMEVAAKVGFEDPYHFSRVFKKLTGSPPKDFQESVRRPGSH